MRSRQTAGIPGDIHVLSRAGLSRTASLAMIEVTGADGQSRRMLIGVGGGAPRLVADLSAAPAPAPARAEVDWFEESDSPAAESAQPTPSQTEQKPASHKAPVGQKLSVKVDDEPGTDPLRAPRKQRVSNAYDAGRGGKDRANLVAEVLAERGSDEPDRTGWRDPWAKNFEAMLGRRSG